MVIGGRSWLPGRHRGDRSPDPVVTSRQRAYALVRDWPAFAAPVGLGELDAAVVAETVAPLEPPAQGRAFYREPGASGRMVFVLGNRERRWTRVSVELRPDPEGCHGRLAVWEWVEDDGQVQGVSELIRLRLQVRRAVVDCGGTFEDGLA